MSDAPRKGLKPDRVGTNSASNALANTQKQSSVMISGAETGSRPGDVSKYPTPTSNPSDIHTMDRMPPSDWLK